MTEVRINTEWLFETTFDDLVKRLKMENLRKNG